MDTGTTSDRMPACRRRSLRVVQDFERADRTEPSPYAVTEVKAQELLKHSPWAALITLHVPPSAATLLASCTGPVADVFLGRDPVVAFSEGEVCVRFSVWDPPVESAELVRDAAVAVARFLNLESQSIQRAEVIARPAGDHTRVWTRPLPERTRNRARRSVRSGSRADQPRWFGVDHPDR